MSYKTRIISMVFTVVYSIYSKNDLKLKGAFFA